MAQQSGRRVVQFEVDDSIEVFVESFSIDDFENENLAYNSDYAKVRAELAARLRQEVGRWRPEVPAEGAVELVL